MEIFERFCSGTTLNVSNKSFAGTKNQDSCMSQLFYFGKAAEKYLVLKKMENWFEKWGTRNY